MTNKNVFQGNGTPRLLEVKDKAKPHQELLLGRLSAGHSLRFCRSFLPAMVTTAGKWSTTDDQPQASLCKDTQGGQLRKPGKHTRKVPSIQE